MATTKKAQDKSTSKEPAKVAAAAVAVEETTADAVSVKAIHQYNSYALNRLVEKGEVVENVNKDRAAMLVEKGLVEII